MSESKKAGSVVIYRMILAILVVGTFARSLDIQKSIESLIPNVINTQRDHGERLKAIEEALRRNKIVSIESQTEITTAIYETR